MGELAVPQLKLILQLLFAEIRYSPGATISGFIRGWVQLASLQKGPMEEKEETDSVEKRSHEFDASRAWKERDWQHETKASGGLPIPEQHCPTLS
jgi:hypothetical protein